MLEEYLTQWEDLRGSVSAVAELLESECLVRGECGELPELEELQSRFSAAYPQIDLAAIPRQAESTASLLSETDSSQSAAGPDRPTARGHYTPSRPGRAPKPISGEQFGRYVIRAELGRGAMGVVYRAYDPNLDIEVALKTTNFDASTAPDMVERFLREARAVAKLERVENICRIYEIDQVDGTYYIAMRLVEGQTLGARFDEHGDGPPMAPREAAKLVRRIASALAAVHKRGIIHRDLKPHNIMIEDGQPVLLDFGLVRGIADVRGQLTTASHMLGTIPYMSPEQIDGQTLAPVSDIYSLGVVLYQLLTGRLPFSPTDPPTKLMKRIADEKPPAPRALRADLDIGLEAVCLKALEKNPADRYQSAEAMGEALARCLQESPPKPQPSSPRTGSTTISTSGGRSAMYQAEISRVNPTCFLFLVDQSGSMAQPLDGKSGKTKAEGVADAINRLLQTLVFRCAKGGFILDRYYIGAIGYGNDNELCLGLPVPALAGEIIRPVSMIGNSPLRIEERSKQVEQGEYGLAERHVVTVPVWFEPKAKGKTPMCAALKAARSVVDGFVSQHPGCFPPTVINITDGISKDDPRPAATALRNVASQDGNVLLLNVHISSRGEKPIKPILFPANESNLPNDEAKLLFRMSSPLPPAMLRQAQILEASVEEGTMGFAFNADLASVVSFLDIGTRVDNRFG